MDITINLSSDVVAYTVALVGVLAALRAWITVSKINASRGRL